MGVALAAPASAADGRVYVYEHINYGGRVCSTEGNVSDYASFCGHDMVSSAWNNGYNSGNRDVIFYEHPNYRGRGTCLKNGQRWARMLPGWNDVVSSHRWSICS
ncbi:peptidase inhibitor family I36 protein [Polyangium mundeleinium]|uniref:Peptidase inhibitor family I36 protein n=1 Tax=Polyangium mundeleinium TaxID=2995306 RepID=A0ABT5EXY2_9BACT|nr:peptidase inhibitor family I36 protein [Polyangium mundeleinium]MDC0746137.1 peptidase inhibitor family I36 protein [Polyangium mundeleinium]